jgi:hypothetical protein
MMRFQGLILAVAVGLLVAPAAVDAGFINASPVGLSNPGVDLTFDEVNLSPGTTVTNQFAAFGVTFAPSAYYDELGNPGYPNVSGNYLTNFIPFVPANTTEFIQFTAPVTAAAFAIVTQTGSTTFTAYLNGSPVDSGVGATNLTSTNNYFGFQGLVFDEIGFTVSSFDRAATFDNLKFSFVAASVPEPPSLILIGVGLGGVAVACRGRAGPGAKSSDKKTGTSTRKRGTGQGRSRRPGMSPAS